jgi:hypothetical protein
MEPQNDQTRPHFTPASPTDRPANTRSRLSNGADMFLAPADGRSREARRFRDVYGDLVQHLGGDEHVSEARRHLAKRACALIVWCELQETKLATGADLDVQVYGSAVNSLRRLLTDLGLDPTVRDVTPSLAQYIAGRSQ